LYSIKRASQFKTDFKTLTKKQKNNLKEVVSTLSKGESLEVRRKDHPLKGKWSSYRDCHVENDLILIYKIENDILNLARVGTHSKLFT